MIINTADITYLHVNGDLQTKQEINAGVWGMVGYTVLTSMNRSFPILSWILSRSLILSRKVGGPKDTLAPHLKKWGGHWPRGPPASYATARVMEIGTPIERRWGFLVSFISTFSSEWYIAYGHFFYTRFLRSRIIAHGNRLRVGPAYLHESVVVECVTGSLLTHPFTYPLTQTLTYPIKEWKVPRH